MNHQTNNMASGVGSNLDSLFNGNMLPPLVSETGFAFQSAGANKWYEKRRKKLAEANKQPAALDILAEPSRASRNRDLARTDTSANLMAYQSDQDSALNRTTNETVEKLDSVAKDDIYAADITPADEIGLASPWNVWVKGSWSVYEAHDSASFDGHMVDVVGGVDYRLADDLIVGVLGGYGMADFDTLTAGTAGSFDADGFHAGVYLGKRLAPNLLLDALVAYTGSDYDNTSGTTTGSFNAHRVTIAAHLKGNIDWGMVTLQPTIGLMYASEKQDAYTDSAAVAHSARTVTAGRLSIGPKFIFQPITSEFGTTQFWFAA
ncbi:MAG: autotransporter outer membrane beta-barrel domain-containing protein, partial [Gammaproteobacteria bacterium]|nr:autotransporter outer membrane beta-barrel domain-containing protein [Gammaproteobacteria bacterium]